MDPLMWLAGLLALSGDVETNPGPTTQTWTCDMCSTEITRRQTSYRCNSSHWVHKHCTTLRCNTDYTPTWKCNIHNQQNNTITDQHNQLTDNNNNMQQNQNINQPHSINNNKTQQQINSKKTITIIQININGLTTKIHELKNLTDNTKIDIITIQETKLKPTHRTPYLKDYTAIRTDRTYKNGGGLMTYIKNDIIFTELKTPHTTNHKLTELRHIKIHLANHKHLHTTSLYVIIAPILLLNTRVFLRVQFLALCFSPCILSLCLPLLNHTLSYIIHLLMTFNYRCLLPQIEYLSYFTLCSHI